MLRRRAHNRIDIPPEELRRLYWDENLSCEEIASRFNCDGLTIRARMRDYAIPFKPRGWHKLVRHIPDSVLDSWPSADLAYVVGLIASDGNLQKQNNCILLVSTDYQIVQLAVAVLGLTNPQIISISRRFPNKKAYMLQISDHKFRSFLEGLGLTPNKTHSMGPLSISDDVFRDFVRGELDGDGTWYVGRGWRGSKYLVSKFTSRSQAYLDWIDLTISRLTHIQGALQASRLYYNGKKAEALGNWIYYDSDIPCLARKRNVWENWMTDAKLAAARK